MTTQVNDISEFIQVFSGQRVVSSIALEISNNIEGTVSGLVVALRLP